MFNFKAPSSVLFLFVIKQNYISLPYFIFIYMISGYLGGYMKDKSKSKSKSKRSVISSKLIMVFGIVFVSMVTFTIYEGGLFTESESKIMEKAKLSGEKIQLDIVDIIDLDYSHKQSMGYVSIHGKIVGPQRLKTKDRECVFNNFNNKKKYEVNGYIYSYKGQTKYHIEDVCKDLKEYIPQENNGG